METGNEDLTIGDHRRYLERATGDLATCLFAPSGPWIIPRPVGLGCELVRELDAVLGGLLGGCR